MSASITCPRCGRTSHNPNDVCERYCGACHAFHEYLSGTDPVLNRVLLPTHHCFDDALEFIGERVTLEPGIARSTRLHLVHGICRAGEAGVNLVADQRYAHAWVEERTLDGRLIVWDAALLNGQRVYYAQRLEDYYAARRVETYTRYTCEEAYRENVKADNFGPWKPEYRALARPRSDT